MAGRLADRLGLRLRVFLFFALIGLCGFGLTIGGLVVAAGGASPEVTHDLVLWVGGAAAATLGLTTWVRLKFDEHVARPIERIGRGAMAAAFGGAGRIGTDGAEYLGPLAAGAEAAAEALAAARAETAKAVAEATQDAARRRRQLEAVLRDLDQAVVICTLDHKVLLYNRRAAALLGSAGELGLGRSLFSVAAAQPFQHALSAARRNVDARGAADGADSVPFVAATADGGRSLQGRLRLLSDPDGGQTSGYVLSFDDVTEDHAGRLRRFRLARRGGASIAAALEDAAGEVDQPETLAGARAAVERFTDEARSLFETAWPKSDVWSTTLFTAIIRRRTGPQNFSAEIMGQPVWLRGDPSGLVEMLDTLLNRIADGLGVRAFQLEALPEEGRVTLEIRWRGDLAPDALLGPWGAEALDAGIGGVTPDELLAAHGAKIEQELRADGMTVLRLRLPAPSQPHESAIARAEARPEFYDFDLLDRPLAETVCEEASLRSLSYVVFDTETTGLNPSGGDRIVQLAGVRIVNGRVLRGEAFDVLVNPGRPIPPAATKIHRITDQMVAVAPRSAQALRRFHAFAEGAVLVAHNAAFDMRFVMQEADPDGPAFDHTVLDTVLLAAHLHGQSDSLTLDALAERFAVDLPAEHRHTALGDSLATAEVLLRLIDMLEAVGVRTLGDALTASRGAAAIRRRQAAY
jgi:DNA polymerase-3 subunit epsilon